MGHCRVYSESPDDGVAYDQGCDLTWALSCVHGVVHCDFGLAQSLGQGSSLWVNLMIGGSSFVVTEGRQGSMVLSAGIQEASVANDSRSRSSSWIWYSLEFRPLSSEIFWVS